MPRHSAMNTLTMYRDTLNYLTGNVMQIYFRARSMLEVDAKKDKVNEMVMHCAIHF